MALRFYQDAYSRSNVVDDNEGKAKAILGMIKSNQLSGDTFHADSLMVKLFELSAGNGSLKRYRIEAEAFLAFQKQQSAKLQSLFIESTSTEQPIETSMLVASWLLFSNDQNKVNSDTNTAGFIQKNYSGLKWLYTKGRLENDETPATAAYALGYLFYNEGENTKAEQYLNEALSVDQAVQNSKGVADDCWLLGKLNFKLLQFEQSGQSFIAANEVYSAIGDTSMANLSEAMGLIAAYKATPNAQTKSIVEQLYKRSASAEVRYAIKRWVQ